VQELAPTTEIRELQKKMDVRKGESKKERQTLGNTFKKEYKNQILATFDFDRFLENLGKAGASKVVLFCVEEYPEACHRSIVANNLMQKYNCKITHL
jgi:uncharacterized protein (DUF488 family)